MGNKLGVFLAGGAIGAALALLYAPRTGVETRAMVAEKANQAWGDVSEYGAKAQAKTAQVYADVAAKGQQVYEQAGVSARETKDTVTAKAQDFISQAQTQVNQARETVRPVFTEKNDELRDKIEAARKRIASQVVKNAEVAHEVMSEKIPVAAGVAVDAVASVHDAVDAAAAKLAGPETAEAEVTEVAAEVAEPVAEAAEQVAEAPEAHETPAAEDDKPAL